MVAVMPPSGEWSATLWVVTHVDLHRTAKVHEFLSWVRKLNRLPTQAAVGPERGIRGPVDVRAVKQRVGSWQRAEL